MKTHAEKLKDIDTRLRRWMPRLTRAQNEVNKLIRQRRKLEGRVMEPDRPTRALPAVTPDTLKEIVSQPSEETDIPVFLKREDEPQLVDRLKAERPPIDKKAMPLSGRAAIEAATTKPRRKTNAV